MADPSKPGPGAIVIVRSLIYFATFYIVTALYLRTKALHVEAERTGIIRDLLRGEATREGYVLLLRNLLPAYRAMEQGLVRHRGHRSRRKR